MYFVQVCTNPPKNAFESSKYATGRTVSATVLSPQWSRPQRRTDQSQSFSPESWILPSRINLDPVIPDPRLDLFPIQVGDDQVGILQRHVAIDAVLANLCTQLHKFTAVPILMTLQTFFRIRRCDTFGRMYLMARCTRHLRASVAAASLRECYLIAVHVNAGLRVGMRQSDVILQLLPRDVRKRRRNCLPDSAMTLRTHLNLTVPG